jgi:hypothetical protein
LVEPKTGVTVRLSNEQCRFAARSLARGRSSLIVGSPTDPDPRGRHVQTIEMLRSTDTRTVMDMRQFDLEN